MAAQPHQDMSLETIGEAGFATFLKNLGEKPKTTIRIFNRGEYYTVHHEDALFTAKDFFKTSTVVKEYGSGNNKIPSVCLSKLNFDKYIRDLLLIKQYKVELYLKKNNQWELSGKASPGNLQYFDSLLFGNNEMADSLVVFSLKLATAEDGQKLVGVAFADAALRQFHVCQFTDSDQFSNLEALLMQIAPKECLIKAQDCNADGGKLKSILERSKILITEIVKADFNSKDILQDLNRLLRTTAGVSHASRPEFDLVHAMSSLASIIKYLELLNDESAFGQFSLKPFDLSQYMHLDVAAVNALNILPQASDGGNRTMCLSGLLNVCKTSQGQRLLGQWVKQPLIDHQKIAERLDIVDAFFNYTNVRKSLQDGPLRHIPDLSRLSKKFYQKKGTLQDCVRIFKAVQQLPNFVEVLNQYDGESKQMIDDIFINPLNSSISDFNGFLELIKTTVDLKAASSQNFIIKAEFDESLQECMDAMEELQSQATSELNKAARDLGLTAEKTVKLDYSPQLGYYFRVTLKEEKGLRNNKKYTTIETRKDGVRFNNSALKNISTDYKEQKDLYNELQTQLVNEVIKVASGYSEPMQILSELTAYLDVLISFATVASQAPIPFVRPTIHPKGTGKILLKGSRHPCLEVQDGIGFIANDIVLNKGSQDFLIITGPNMGGKSTFIRQAGLITLMAQIGSFVPCDSAEISIVDSILARVGSGDSQLKGVSTFMAEMLETASILRCATENSLVIIDELGRGTSTYDGFGLAWAISEHIASELKSYCLFATHFHELTSLADEIPSVKNFHVAALTSKDELTLLYRVKPGVCDQSFGIHVAEVAHFPKNVIQFAKEKAKELENFQISNDIGDNNTSYDETSTDASTAKKRRLMIQESNDTVARILKQIRGSKIHNKSDEEIISQIKQIKEELLGSGNQYLLRCIGN